MAASMTDPEPPVLAQGEALPASRISQRTLIQIRWIGVVGQLVTVLIVQYGLSYDLPLAPALAIIAVSAMLNLAAIIQGRLRTRLSPRDAAIYLAYDAVQLSAMLFLTGGMENPFVILLLAPLTVGALILPLKLTVALTYLTVICVTLLAFWQYPIPGADEAAAAPAPFVYRLGVWIALTLAAMLIAAYVWSVAEEGRQMAAGLSETRLALAREQQVSAVGALAAAAAHELGTPLGTIALAARELDDDLPAESSTRADALLIVQESQRCREILAELTRHPAADGGAPFELLTLPGLIEAASMPFQRPGIEIAAETVPRDSSRAPQTRRTPEAVHGLGNLLQNAIQFARRRVSVRAEWSRREVTISIADDGPGFAHGVLSRLGDPYVSGKDTGRGSGESHMGLGIFIAVTLLARNGARVRFANARHGGAQVTVTWPRDRFEAKA